MPKTFEDVIEQCKESLAEATRDVEEAYRGRGGTNCSYEEGKEQAYKEVLEMLLKAQEE